MRKHKLGIVGIIALTGLLMSCGQERQEEKKTEVETQSEAKTEQVESQKQIRKRQKWSMTKNGITLRASFRSTEFPDAKLSLLSKTSNLKPGESTFEFSVENYKLGAQTPGRPYCANSPKGQHIHFILNNGPYSAHYEPSVTKELPEGKHLMVAFLSRSYHESVKNGQAHVVRQLTVGEAKGDDIDLTAEHLIYSRPKGTYKGEDMSPLLLDFFLLNTTLDEKGNKVRITIDDTEFTVSNWVPYVVEGLEPGDHTFRIQLIDKDGNQVPGPYNDSGERTVTLEEAAS